MNTLITQDQINSYQKNGFIIIEDFLHSFELDRWRKVFDTAVAERDGRKMPHHDVKLGEDDGINKDVKYFNNVFDQLLNLWQTNIEMEKLMVDKGIGKMAAQLAGVDGIRIWHDQALIKKPWANPTAWHLDTPFWSFSDRNALSIWIALDDATLENGCLFFIPGSHQKTRFENVPLGRNVGGIFDLYPEFRQSKSVAAPMKAGSCSFHNGLTIHGAHANMTPGSRRAMTCAYMPDGNLYNGTPNILPEYYLKNLKIGELLDDDKQNPLIFKA